MNDISGHWMPPEEDGNETAFGESMFDLICRNVSQRIRELQTRREDEELEIPVADARKRLVEAR